MGAVYTVTTYAELPISSENIGRLYLVEDESSFYVSDPIVGWKILINPTNRIWTWGRASNGDLGTGNKDDKSSPVTTADGGTTWTKLSGSSAAIKSNNTLWLWGANNYGQLGNNTTLGSCIPTKMIFGDGWKQASRNIVSNHALAVKTDGTLWAWGSNTCGRLGDNTTTSRSSPVTTAGGGAGWSQVAAGCTWSMALKNEGTLWTWGDNTCGVLGTNNTTNRSSPGTIFGGGANWCFISAGLKHNVAVKTDGTLWSWGLNTCGRLGDNTTTNRSSPVTPSGGGTDWYQASAGSDSTVALKINNTLWTWGSNVCGALGDGTITNRSSPGTVAGGGTNWCQVTAGFLAGAAIKFDGTLWTWGSNTNGQLGTNNLNNRCSPGTTIGGGTNWCSVAAGYKNMFAIQTVFN